MAILNETIVSAIAFYVKDLKRTKEFYHDVLGVEIREGYGTEDGDEHTYMIAEAGPVSLVFFEGKHPPGQTPLVVFGVTAGIEEIVEDLARAGVEIVLPVSEAPGGLTADFLDPDGHTLSLYQSFRSGELKGNS